MRLRLITGLVLKDIVHEFAAFACSTIGLAAVLAPLLLLFALRSGIVEGMRSDLIDDPRAREIVNVVNRGHTQAFFDALTKSPDVAFVIPRTRTLSATILLANTKSPQELARAELFATAPGDPLLRGLSQGRPDEIILSDSLARRLGLAAGDQTIASVQRQQGGQMQAAQVVLQVSAIAPASRFARDAVFAPLAFNLGVEDFQDGRLSALTEPTQFIRDPDRRYAGFRIYAKRLEDVSIIDRRLRPEGEVFSRIDDVEMLLSLDRNLTLLFLLIAGLGGGGFVLSLGVGIWSAIDRKQGDLGILRLLGATRSDMILFPFIHGQVVALCGAGIATILALSICDLMNTIHMTGGGTREIGVLSGSAVSGGAAVSVICAAIATVIAGWRAARITPVEGMRGT
jgi:putative ABC transport system permease protein